MQQKTKDLLNLWYACLIDHHKDRDCYFNISKVFCCYKETDDWLVTHDGYLYEWEYTTASYEHAEEILQTKLIGQITEECRRGISEQYCYTERQKSVLTINLVRLQEYL